MWYVHLWALAKDISTEQLQKMLRVVQILSCACVIVAFVMRVPGVVDRWESNHLRILQVLGLESVVIDTGVNYEWLSRSHRFILAFAISISEAFFVCN